jgi:hypothetical protein
MTHQRLALATVLTSLTLATGPLVAQERAGVMGDLMRDVETVKAKIVGLARAMPLTVYEWRLGQGVRSTGEVFIHVAGDNYFLRSNGVTPPWSK